jgi:enamine deaminase RidA (YjgF/YER057c/UK114 family)
MICAPAIAQSRPLVKPALSNFPDALIGETQKLEFHVSTPLSNGSLQTQTRAALQELIRKNHGATIIKLRAFAIGADNLTAIQAVIHKTLKDQKLPLPVLALVGVAGFPDAGQQVEIESTANSIESRNPDGVAFLAGLAAPAGDRTIDGLARVAREGGISADNILRISCFYESADQVDSAKKSIAKAFPSAESSFVFSYASAAKPLMECEGVARMTGQSANGVRYFNFFGEQASPNFSRAALVRTRRLVFTGTPVATGDSEADLHKLLEQLKSAIEAFGAKLPDVIMSDNYWLSASARDQLRTVRAQYYGKTVPAATGVFFTGLSSKNATAALELVVAVPDTITLAVGSPLMDGTRLYKSHLATMTQSTSKDGVTSQSRSFRMDKFVIQKDGVTAFRLLIDSVPGGNDPKFHSETILNLQNMALVYRTEVTVGGLNRVFEVDGAHVTGHEQTGQETKPIDFTNEIPSFYAPFLDAAVNAINLHGGEIFRIPTFDLLTRKTEWHNYRVAGRDTVLVKKRKVSAWIIEEENQPRYKLRRIWLIKEPPFFPLDLTYLPDGSIRRVEQTLVRLHS